MDQASNPHQVTFFILPTGQLLISLQQKQSTSIRYLWNKPILQQLYEAESELITYENTHFKADSI